MKRIGALARPRALLLALAMVLAATPGSAKASGAALPAPIVQALHGAGIGLEQVGAHVVALDVDMPATGSTVQAALSEARVAQPVLLAHGADVPFNPASTMKLLTTHAALALLGPHSAGARLGWQRARLSMAPCAATWWCVAAEIRSW